MRLAGFEQAIELRRKSEQEAQAFILTGVAKAQMDAIRELVGEMRKDEHDLLRDRQRRSSLAYQTAVTSGLVTALVGLGLVAAFVWLLHRSLLAPPAGRGDSPRTARVVPHDAGGHR